MSQIKLTEGLRGHSKSYASMSKGELMRHAYALQSSVAKAPESLSRFTAKDVSLMLAEPDLERKDYPSVAWQYRSQSCVLDVFYAAPDEDALEHAKVKHFEIRPRGLITHFDKQSPVQEQDCLQSLYRERQKMIEAGFRQIYALNDADAG